ncbi:zinc finger C-x8-C-x5-C-x3-H type protein [Rhizoctonia solani AG-3 Rhs1AP]|uniref:Zinc finger C-x8-C-x5-C-x3-H type protein n=1 Tax=Rhizoctonia solani AG-3 Rhs1AP TaxID=1086054 RepID=X8JW93_9AGAM|nr:zinc finger C-x8-C-x5-C-x3-H type protein [Rhizoctonia solani AG-3 Rhs1AP]
MYLTRIQPTTHALALEFASHDLHDTEPVNNYKHQPAMADPSRNEDDGQKTTQRPTLSPNKIDHDVDRSTPPFTKRSSMRPMQGAYSPSPLILGGRSMLSDYASDTKISVPMSAIEADKSSSFSEFNNGPVSAAPGRGAKFAGRQGWSFKGNPSIVDDTLNSGWDVADEMSRLQVTDSRENALSAKHDLPQDHPHPVPHSGDSASSISPTAQTNEPGDSTLFSYSHSRSPSSVTTSSDGPASVLTPLHQSKSSMDPKALQDDADRAYSMEKPPFGSHQFSGHQDRPSTQHPVPQYPQNVHAHMAVGPAPSMPLESSAEHYDYRNHSLPSHSSANEDHSVDYRYAPEMGVRTMPPAMPMPVTMPQAVPASAHYAPGIDYRYAPPQGTYPAPPPGAYPPPMPPAAPQPMYGADMHQHHERGVSAGYPHGHAPHLHRPVHHHSASDPAALRDAAALLLQTYPHLGHVSGPVYGAPYSPSTFYTQADAYTPALAQALARQLQYDAPGYLRENHGGPSANNRKLGLYKTELCRSWEEKGSCRYGPKCQFAHGEDEIRRVARHPKYKTEICRTFWVSGSCPYGKRCCFIHTELPIAGQPLPGATPSPSNADASRSANQQAPVPPDGRARSLSTNSDPNDQPSSLLARISAKSRESTGGNNAHTRPEVTSPTSATTVQAEQAFVPYGRHGLGSLRVDTALDGTPAHAVSAFPFSANPGISTTRPSPGPATATGDYANRHFGDISSGLMSQRLAPMSPMTPVSVQNSHRYSLSGDASIPSLANRSPEARISGGSTPFNVNGTPGEGHPGRITPSSTASPFHGRSGSGQWVNQTRHAPSPSFGSASNSSANPNEMHNWSEVAVGPNSRQWS